MFSRQILRFLLGATYFDKEQSTAFRALSINSFLGPYPIHVCILIDCSHSTIAMYLSGFHPMLRVLLHCTIFFNRAIREHIPKIQFPLNTDDVYSSYIVNK